MRPEQRQEVARAIFAWAGVSEIEAGEMSTDVLYRRNVDRRQAIVATAYALALDVGEGRARDLHHLNVHELAALAALLVAMRTSEQAVDTWLATYGKGV
jgi:hypothetical protein